MRAAWHIVKCCQRERKKRGEKGRGGEEKERGREDNIYIYSVSEREYD